MSDKIKKHQQSNKKIVLTDVEFAYLTSLDTVGQSFAYYISQLKTSYLQTLLVERGISTDKQYELSIDLKDESHVLTVSEVKQA